MRDDALAAHPLVAPLGAADPRRDATTTTASITRTIVRPGLPIGHAAVPDERRRLALRRRRPPALRSHGDGAHRLHHPARADAAGAAGPPSSSCAPAAAATIRSSIAAPPPIRPSISRWSPGTGPALQFARAGFAGVQIDGPLGGLRNSTNGDEEFLIFNVLNPSALRDNVRQSAHRAVAAGARAAVADRRRARLPGRVGRAAFDAAHLALMGHSMGAWIAPLALAFEPTLRRRGPLRRRRQLHRQRHGQAEAAPACARYAEILLDYNMDQRSLDAARSGADAPAVGRRAVRSAGLCAARRCQRQRAHAAGHRRPLHPAEHRQFAVSLALGLDAARPALRRRQRRRAIARPTGAGDAPAARRAPAIALPALATPRRRPRVVVQHPGDGIEDGHEVVFQTEAPKHQYRCFLQSFARGAPSIPADGAADDPCP